MAQTIQQPLPPMEVTRVDRRRSTPVNPVDRERDWLALVGVAMGRAGVSQKVMAIELGVDRGLLSAQLSGAPHKHLSFRRMAMLSREFWRELVLLIIAFYDLQIGVSEQDRRDMETGRALRELVTRVRG